MLNNKEIQEAMTIKLDDEYPDYPEFVEGIRPVVVDKFGNDTSTAHADTTVIYRPYSGIFKMLCEKAAKSPPTE